MAEHECRYVGFSGGKRLCPVCLSEEPTATGEDHGDQSQDHGEAQDDGEVNDEAGGESTDDVNEDVDDQPEEEPEPKRRRSSLVKQRDDQPV